MWCCDDNMAMPRSQGRIAYGGDRVDREGHVALGELSLRLGRDILELLLQGLDRLLALRLALLDQGSSLVESLPRSLTFGPNTLTLTFTFTHANIVMSLVQCPEIVSD